MPPTGTIQRKQRYRRPGPSPERYLRRAPAQPILQAAPPLLCPFFLLDARAELPYSSVVEGLEEFLYLGGMSAGRR